MQHARWHHHGCGYSAMPGVGATGTPHVVRDAPVKLSPPDAILRTTAPPHGPVGCRSTLHTLR